MPIEKHTLIALCVLSLLGCGSEAEPSFRAPAVTTTVDEATVDPPAREAEVLQPAFVVPSDLMTGTLHLQPTVIFHEREIPPETLAELIARTQLVSWPDRSPVETRPDFSPADTVEHVNTSELTLVPTDELGDGWYAVLFDARGLEGYRGTGIELEPGLWASRFRTDSQPIVRSIGIANSAEGRAHVRIEISERVQDDREGSALVTVSAGGRVLPCETAEDGVVPMAGGTYVSLYCPTVEVDAPLTVALARDFGGALPVRFAFGGDGTTVTFRPSEGAGRIDEEAVFVPRGEEARP